MKVKVQKGLSGAGVGVAHVYYSTKGGGRKWRTRRAYNERRRTCTDGLKWNDDRAGGRLLFVDHAASRTHTLGGRIGHGGWTMLGGRAAVNARAVTAVDERVGLRLKAADHGIYSSRSVELPSSPPVQTNIYIYIKVYFLSVVHSLSLALILSVSLFLVLSLPSRCYGAREQDTPTAAAVAAILVIINIIIIIIVIVPLSRPSNR